MFEGVLGSLAAKAVYSLAGVLGLFGGLAVTGVLPVLGDNAADRVVVDAIAVAGPEDHEIVVNPIIELPSVSSAVSEVPVVSDVAASLPSVEGVVSNSSSPTELPAVGLVGTLLNSLTGTVDGVLASLPVLNQVLPGLPVGAGALGVPASASSAIALDPVTDTLTGVTATVGSVTAPVEQIAGSVTSGLPLANELLRTAEAAIFSLVPGLLVVVS